MMTRPALVLLVLAAIAPASAEAKRPGCGAGVGLFTEGRLHVFAVPYRTADESGYDEWACVGRRGPWSVGLVGANTGVGSTETQAYAFAGGRFLGSYQVTDGEGGPSASIGVSDLRTRRTVAYTNIVCCGPIPSFFVAGNGALLTGGEQVDLLQPHRSHARTLSTPGVRASDLALVGNLAYWTEHPAGAEPVARSATLPGVPAGPEARVLAPVRPRPHSGACVAARGRTITRSSSVRVYERGSRRVACRIGGPGPMRIGPANAPAPRIVKDRWLLVLGSGAKVIDTRANETVTRVGAAVRRATLLADGTLAWIEEGGRVLAQAPAADAPTELAPADPAPGALAGSGRTVYWSAGGAPHAARMAAAAATRRSR